MTPAVNAARNAGIAYTVLEYDSSELRAGGGSGYGEEAARVLGLPAEQVLKTLVADLDGSELVIAIIPVSRQLDFKALAAYCGTKRARIADPKAAERATGYALGGISPLGQRRRLPTVVDASASRYETVYVSGGRRGIELALAPADLIALCGARSGDIAR